MYNTQSMYQGLSDRRSDLVAQFQHARRMSNKAAMHQACADITATDVMLREEKCLILN